LKEQQLKIVALRDFFLKNHSAASKLALSFESGANEKEAVSSLVRGTR
jgi:hypothetical protein